MLQIPDGRYPNGILKRPTWNCMKQKADTFDNLFHSPRNNSSDENRRRLRLLDWKRMRGLKFSRLDFAAEKKELHAENNMIIT